MPLLWLSLAFIVGIILGANFPLPTSSWILLFAAAFILALVRIIWNRSSVRSLDFLLAPRQLPVSIPILLIACTLGSTRYQSSLPDFSDPDFIAFYNQGESQMMVTGLVNNLPDVRDNVTYLRVSVEYMHASGDLNIFKVDGLVQVSTDPHKHFQYGDRVVIRGYLETPPQDESFSYREYLARQGIHTLIRNARVSTLETNQGSWWMGAIYRLKAKALENTYRIWPDPEASLFAGILLGVESNIPESVQLAFQETGTSHIIAISGFNIAIVAGLFTRILGRVLGPYRGGAVALAAIAIYTILVGADAAVLRAAILGGLSLLAGLVGRRQVGVYALCLTAGIMSFGNPHILWDVGFQLSFAATLGLVLFADPLQQAVIRLASRWVPAESAEKIAAPVSEFFLFTFAAQLTTLPLLAYHFGGISWLAFLANPVILPVQPPIMVLGGISLILSLVWLPLGQLSAPLAWPFVLFTIRAVEFFGEQTRGTIALGDFSLLWLVAFYLALLSVTYGWHQIQTWLGIEKERIRAALALPAILVLGVAAVLLWRLALTAPDGRLHLTLLDVGTGDAILVTTPGGRNLLVDGGPSTRQLSDGLGRRLPPFRRELDWLVVASPVKEQVAGLPRAIERFPPASVLWAGLASPSREADYLREKLSELQIPNVPTRPGHSIDLGEGAFLYVLAAGPRGAILLIEWDRFRLLLPLGISEGDFEHFRMGKEIGRVSVLLLADNGYAPTNPAEWINNLNPQLVLLSVASGDHNGLPDQDLLETLTGYPLLRTDQNGWIQVTTNGQQMWVDVER